MSEAQPTPAELQKLSQTGLPQTTKPVQQRPLNINLKKAHFELFMNRNKAPCFRLRAPNGEILLQSEAYSSKEAVKIGIEAIRKYAATAELREL